MKLLLSYAKALNVKQVVSYIYTTYAAITHKIKFYGKMYSIIFNKF